jgi:CheY-like chemotaxis protein
MDGYAACRALKNNPQTHDIPVIFLSALTQIEDRLAGYEAGGDDYITKPFDPEELRSKIDVVLRNCKENRELRKQASYATTMAMTAMSAVGDSGIILRFLRDMLACLDLASLNEVFFRTMDEFGRDASIQLRDGTSCFSRSRDGICSPLEDAVLTNMGSCGRIVDLGTRTAFNHKHVSIIIKDMPLDDAPLYGRIKDNMAIVAEAIDVHLQSLQVVNEALHRGDIQMQILQRTTTAIRKIEESYREQRTVSSKILNELAENVEDSFIHLGLTENQERYIQDMVRNAVNQAQALYDQTIEVEAIMDRINQDMGHAMQQEINGMVEASDNEKRIELF